MSAFSGVTPPPDTFLVSSTTTISVVAIEPSPPRGLVGVDAHGRWNHGRDAGSTLSMIVDPEVAREWGRALIEAAAAAESDELQVKRAL